MKNFVMVMTICLMMVCFIGCGSPLAVGGAGVGIGAALQHTIAGAKADLDVREAALVEAYNQGVEIGMEQEDLDQIKQQIRDIQLTRQTIETGESFLSVDWNDPKQTGGAIGIVSSLILLWFNRKKLKSTTKELVGTKAGISKFEGMSEPEVASKLHDIVKAKTANL